ncbi:alpha-amylase [Aerococcus urinaehominis]|uniref:Alpha-amylase n=1 Tax=Aerococcus urinaehominis TaxID=128944 RepID=A0A120IAV9_9LACT|nr:alpha-amylase [Aerococcus urinaehominis]AMB99293.1 alpha-amylase [Aerococcus urinaehominis]SDM19236.1 alpha-amylase [Aerococcus urinaehominis]
MTNGTLIQYFEFDLPDDGKHWQNTAEDAKHLADIGFSHIWLPPATKGTGTNDTGYGVYDLYDLGEFDQKGAQRTKYGTKEEYLNAIKALQEQGISVLADVVLNHRMGADELEKFPAYEMDPNDRNKVIEEAHEIEAWTHFTFPGRQGKYSDFEWRWYHFSGVDYDQSRDKSGIYMVAGEGKGWADNENVDNEKANYDYLMGADVDYDREDTVEEIKKWTKWFLETTGVDGFRFDAVKHIDDGFIESIAKVASEVNEDFYAIGEYWKYHYHDLENYLKDTDYQLDLFDVMLHFHFKEASEAGANYDMAKLLDNTLLTLKPQQAVTFVDNHDTQLGQSLASWVQPWFKPIAYGIILMHKEGLPCVFYGDYYGLSQVDEENGYQADIDKMMTLRTERAYGDQEDYFDHGNCVGFSRLGDADHPDGLALLCSNGDAGFKKMYVGQDKAGQVWIDYLAYSDQEVTIDDSGYGEFSCPAGGISIWTQNNLK